MAAERRRAAFIDRDGVINQELGYVYRVENFHLLPGAAEGLLTLQQCGFALVVITNQAGIARGMYSQDDFMKVTDHMKRTLARSGVEFLAVYFCPHHPEGSMPALTMACGCRKPAPGMLLKAAEEHGLDLAASVLVGDKRTDIEAGRAAGIGRNILVRSGHPFSPEAAVLAQHVCDDLATAARYLCAERGPGSTPL